MRNILKLPACALLFLSVHVCAQSNNLGVGTSAPASKLTVNGSFAAAYKSVAAAAYSASENDFYVVWKDTAAGTITLPASTTGMDRKGRLYFFKNNSDTYALIIDAAGTEKIDTFTNIVLLPGETVLLVKTNINAATGTTYEVAQMADNKTKYVYSVSSSVSETHVMAATIKQNYSTLDIGSNGGGDFNFTTDTWTCPQSGFYKVEAIEGGMITGSNMSTHVAIILYKNGSTVGSSFYSLAVLGTASNSASNGHYSNMLFLTKNDQIYFQAIVCNGCGPASVTSYYRQMIITRQ